jgi:hypothetical protein
MDETLLGESDIIFPDELILFELPVKVFVVPGVVGVPQLIPFGPKVDPPLDPLADTCILFTPRCKF